MICKKLWIAPLAAMLLAAACSETLSDDCPESRPAQPRTIRIAPLIATRVSDTHFDPDDRIGVTLQLQSGSRYLDNQQFVFDGTQFAADDVVWYDSEEETATLFACYPYLSAGLPAQFTVRSDQRNGGYDASNLIGACNKGVTPTAEAVQMTFRHLMSRIDIEIEAADEVNIGQITLSGLLPTVAIDWEQLTAGTASGTAAEIVASPKTANRSYVAAVPPQTATMQVTVTTDRSTLTKRLAKLEMRQGMYYTLQLAIREADESLELVVKGEIENWEDGGPIGEDPEAGDTPGDEESDPKKPSGPTEPDGGSLSYGGVSYRTQQIDGRVWMAENLRYQPSGGTVYYPAEYNDPRDADVETNGLLYPYATALAGASEGTEPVQGICPAGWRLPTISELETLAAKADGAFFTQAGHYMLTGSQKYSTAQSYLLSSTLADGRLSYLDVSAKEVKTLPKGNIAASVRCVKAQ